MKEELNQNIAVLDVRDYVSEEYGEGVMIRIYESARPVINGEITRVLRQHEYIVDELYHRPDHEEYRLFAHPRNPQNENGDS